MDKASQPPKIHHRLDFLDGLRGLAILLVLLLHYWELTWVSPTITLLGTRIDFGFLFTTGTIGVQLFFFISGFCLHWAKYTTFAEFYSKRAAKILPSYLLAIAVIVSLKDLGLGSWTNQLWHIFTHLTFINNWWHDTSGSINGVFWSLAVEVQFYLIFPLIHWAFKKSPLVTTALLCVTAITYRITCLKLDPKEIHFWLNQLPASLDLFAGGMLTAHLLRSDRLQFRPRVATSIAFASTLSFLGLLYWAHEIRYTLEIPPWRAYFTPLLVLCFMGIALSSSQALPTWRRALANPIFVFLGAISYNLYIWHQFIGRELISHKLPNFIGEATTQPTLWRLQFWLLASFVSIALSWVFTKAVEDPVLKWNKRRLKKGSIEVQSLS